MLFISSGALSLLFAIFGFLLPLVNCYGGWPEECNPKVQDTTVDAGCTRVAVTPGNPESDTCTKLSSRNGITLEKFFALNPFVTKDCMNLSPCTEYCVGGARLPVSEDGFCGPQHNNATCKDTEKPCCNSKTWQCGDKTEDCKYENCFEGDCLLRQVNTTNGQCGLYRKKVWVECAEQWGSCCNLDNVCGNGDKFCGEGICQMGSCASPNIPLLYSPPALDLASLDDINSTTTSTKQSASATASGTSKVAASTPSISDTPGPSALVSSNVTNAAQMTNANTTSVGSFINPERYWSLAWISVFSLHLITTGCV